MFDFVFFSPLFVVGCFLNEFLYEVYWNVFNRFFTVFITMLNPLISVFYIDYLDKFTHTLPMFWYRES